jgi:hypothetical protein
MSVNVLSLARYRTLEKLLILVHIGAVWQGMAGDAGNFSRPYKKNPPLEYNKSVMLTDIDPVLTLKGGGRAWARRLLRAWVGVVF